MKQSKASELRSKSSDELQAQLAELRKEQFNLRFQKATSQLKTVTRSGEVKRQIAQILTLLNERRHAATKATAKKAA